MSGFVTFSLEIIIAIIIIYKGAAGSAGTLYDEPPAPVPAL